MHLDAIDPAGALRPLRSFRDTNGTIISFITPSTKTVSSNALLNDTICYTFPFLQSQPFSVFYSYLFIFLNPWTPGTAQSPPFKFQNRPLTIITLLKSLLIHAVTIVFVVSLSNWTVNSRQKITQFSPHLVTQVLGISESANATVGDESPGFLFKEVKCQ